MKAKIIQLPVNFLCLVLFIGYSIVPLHKITIKGSDTMVLLSKEWAGFYIQKQPGTSIHVSGGGSGFGIAELFFRSAEIANSSRPIDFSELEKIKEKYYKKGVEIPCSKDGL